MSDVETCTSINNLGTAVLLQALIDRPVERLVVASSKSIYGEGCYHTLLGQPADAIERPSSQLKTKEWEVHDASGEPLVPVPTPETKPPSFGSVHALSKFDQERLCLMIGEAHRLPTIALRFFNVYGPRQPLTYPHGGVLALFAARMLNGHRPWVFEDGAQRRDFINVHDAARACCLALDAGPTVTGVFNVGSGQPYTVLEVADTLAHELGRELAPQVTGRYRNGDIRHCFADIQAASRALDFVSEVSFKQGIRELVDWLQCEAATTDHLQRTSYPDMERELSL
jgi:dTDP-L-rhamnose 4-epimerase